MMLTPLGIRAAQLWLQKHGRRFGVYRKKMTAHKPHEHQPGSKAAIETARKVACKTAAAGEGRLMLGFKAAEVKFGGSVDGPKVTRKLKLYERATKAKKRINHVQRQRLGMTGRNSDIPVPKQPSVFSRYSAAAASGVVLNLTGRELHEWPNCRIRTLLEQHRASSVHAFQACKLADVVVVPVLTKGFPSATETDPVIWGACLAAVALGTSCIGFKSWDEASWNHMLRFQRVVDVVPVLAQTTARFESRHRDVCTLFGILSGMNKSRWKILSHEQASSPEHVQLNKMEDLAKLLLKAQRVGGAKVGGHYF